MNGERWEFWIDVGGTFTDCMARRPDGSLLRQKVLSSTPDAPLHAIRQFLDLRQDQPIPPCVVRLGTTRGTNALLTRQGAKVGFVTTRGHGDVLRIGYQNRPKLFELAIKKPAPLLAAVAEIDERIAAEGTVLRPLDPQQAWAELLRLKVAGIESLAICLLNAYANPAHEEQLAELAREVGFAEISVSTRVSPLMKLVPRGDTTVVDAYLNPVLRSYVERLAASLPGSDVSLMTSAGGLVPPAGFTGKDSILSGPAGGVVAVARVAQAAGFTSAIGFDMGGTSTDVSRYDGRFEYEFETEKAGVRIVAPMLAIETVAAGGGSICRWDGVKLVVGPESAGADPGPACYGRGGPLTVTDCNLYLGRLRSEHFPFPLDRSAVERRLEEVAAENHEADWQIMSGGDRRTTKWSDPSRSDELRNWHTFGQSGQWRGPRFLSGGDRRTALAEGFLRIANANMAQAIRSISLAKGYDPRHYGLVAFGSAGPQHACAVAAELGIRGILIHPDAGLLSALGMGLADVIKHRSAGIYRLLNDESLSDAAVVLDRLARQAIDELGVGEENASRITLVRSLDLRYAGTDAPLSIPEPGDRDYPAAFEAEHRRLYGYIHAGRPLEIVAARIEAVRHSANRLSASTWDAELFRPQPSEFRPVWLDGKWQQTPCFERDQLPRGASFMGPALVREPFTTTVIDPGWQAFVYSGEMRLLDCRPASKPQIGEAADPAWLELLSNHFTAIATQMGITLRNTATSVNVKERLDFSCALFTGVGELVVNAPHIPVHLGAMAETVKAIIGDNPDMQPGDAFVTNDPYRGGSHLPDVTVITPIFAKEQARAAFFVANRAHHAEIGGITPGSMPPFSRSLAEEGVLIRNFKLLEGGSPRLDSLRELLTSGPHPSRAPDVNLADITAQLAANQQGAMDLARLVDRYSLPVVQAYMRHIQEAAERKTRAVLARQRWRRREFVDHLDDGTSICVAVTTAGPTAIVDFTGTGPVSAGNLNANRAIVTAAVTYVLRLLVGEELPLNQGMLAPVQIILRECLLNPPAGEQPEDCPAVVGGNVETSQRVVDVLLAALGLAAASQGTMNNLLFGDATFGYYETICGGSGATHDADGADAVHTHMTNTRLTDPEVLEARYPVRLVEFAVRRGSGGQGRRRGGDGVIRRIEFLRPLTLSILSQRRGAYPPFGMNGGCPGAFGVNRLVRAGGQNVELCGSVQIDVQPGDVLTIETPGGGGWGAPEPKPPNT